MFSPRFILCLVSVLAGLAGASPVFAADPAREIGTFSAFKSINTQELAGGNILSERGSSPNFDRGISVQTCYVVRKPVDSTVRLLTSWNPTSHPELEIYSSRIFESGAEPKFEALRLDSTSEPVRRLLEETHKGVSDAPSFQFSANDAALLRKVISADAAEKAEPDSAAFRKMAEQFWATLLKGRYDAFKGGGITALPPYQLDEQSIPVHGELIALLSQAPAIQSRFKKLLTEAILQPASKAPAPPASYYWQALNSDKQASCCLGAIYTSKEDGKWQVADYQLFSSHSYLTMITLYELWPLKTGAEDCTLVWRADFVSAPSFSSLHGVEQMAAAALMTKSIKNNIRFFQEDALHSSTLSLSERSNPVSAIEPR